MVRYRCGECGRESDFVECYREDHGEERTCCPTCHAPAGEPLGSCAVCGGAIDGEAGVCPACAESVCRADWQAVAAWLKTRPGRLGWFSWTDFVLGEVFGISECRDEAMLTAALTPQAENAALTGRGMAELLWAYISADCDSFREFAEWIGECL